MHMQIFTYFTIYLTFFCSLVSLENCDKHTEDAVVCIDNNLTTIPTSSSPNISVLILSYNQIAKLDDETLNFYKNLQALFLDYNDIKTSDDLVDLIKAHNLQYLNIASNKLSYLDFNIFSSNVQLKMLLLDNNPELVLAARSAALPALKILSMNNCNLSSIPLESIKGFRNLEHLHFLSNHIESVRELKAYFPKLKQLSLQGNTVKDIDSFSLELSDIKNSYSPKKFVKKIGDYVLYKNKNEMILWIGIAALAILFVFVLVGFLVAVKYKLLTIDDARRFFRYMQGTQQDAADAALKG